MEYLYGELDPRLIDPEFAHATIWDSYDSLPTPSEKYHMRIAVVMVDGTEMLYICVKKPAVPNQYIWKIWPTEEQGIGRFLSGWNSVTGLPTTAAPYSPFPYRVGDWFKVKVAPQPGASGLMPWGTQYIQNTPSTHTTTDNIDVGDMFIYTGSGVWELIHNTADVFRSGIAGLIVGAEDIATNHGKIKANSDGTGSLIGWESLAKYDSDGFLHSDTAEISDVEDDTVVNIEMLQQIFPSPQSDPNYIILDGGTV